MSIDRASLSSLVEWQTVDGLHEAGLRPGSKVRVRLATDRDVLTGKLESFDEWSLVIELPKSLSLVARNEIETVTLRRIPWSEVSCVWVRGRAVEHGLAWGAAWTLVLGWCGNAVDRIGGGSPAKPQLVVFGAFIGMLIGYLVSLGRRWKIIYTPPSEL